MTVKTHVISEYRVVGRLLATFNKSQYLTKIRIYGRKHKSMHTSKQEDQN
jgi:hypothetical protein